MLRVSTPEWFFQSDRAHDSSPRSSGQSSTHSSRQCRNHRAGCLQAEAHEAFLYAVCTIRPKAPSIDARGISNAVPCRVGRELSCDGQWRMMRLLLSKPLCTLNFSLDSCYLFHIVGNCFVCDMPYALMSVLGLLGSCPQACDRSVPSPCLQPWCSDEDQSSRAQSALSVQ